MSKENRISRAPGISIEWPLIQSFQTELNRMFDRFNATPFGADHKLIPTLDIAETENVVEITAEIPAVRTEDLDILISDQTLIIKGQKNDPREDHSKDWHHVERSFGSFCRHVPLGFNPKDAKIDARFEGGVLTIRIDKPADAAATTRKIDITGV